MTMTSEQKEAYAKLFAASDALTSIIIHARSEMHPLELPSLVVLQLIEARQTVFAAQRTLESQ